MNHTNFIENSKKKIFLQNNVTLQTTEKKLKHCFSQKK